MYRVYEFRNSRCLSHLTAASRLCEVQVIAGLLSQAKREPSSPVHSRPPRWIGPVPGPKVLMPPGIGVLPAWRRYDTRMKLVKFEFHTNVRIPQVSSTISPCKQTMYLCTYIVDYEQLSYLDWSSPAVCRPH